MCKQHLYTGSCGHELAANDTSSDGFEECNVMKNRAAWRAREHRVLVIREKKDFACPRCRVESMRERVERWLDGVVEGQDGGRVE